MGRDGGRSRGPRGPRGSDGSDLDLAAGAAGVAGTDGVDGVDGVDGAEGAPAGPPGDPEAVARIVCLRLLDRRARTRAELEQALARRDVPADAAARVLDRFADVGLIDDAALAASVAESAHRDRGLARRAVALKLKQRGVDDEVVSEAVEGIDADAERSRAVALVQRKHRTVASLAPEVQTRRLVALLARKGYPPGLAYEVVRDVVRSGAGTAGGDVGGRSGLDLGGDGWDDPQGTSGTVPLVD